MEEKSTQTPTETEQALYGLAEKLEEMDRAEGFFGESMAEALTDEYLEEVVGGFPAVTVTTPGRQKCYLCGKEFADWMEFDIKLTECMDHRPPEKCPYCSKDRK